MSLIFQWALNLIHYVTIFQGTLAKKKKKKKQQQQKTLIIIA